MTVKYNDLIEYKIKTKYNSKNGIFVIKIYEVRDKDIDTFLINKLVYKKKYSLVMAENDDIMVVYKLVRSCVSKYISSADEKEKARIYTKKNFISYRLVMNNLRSENNV